MPVLSLQYIGLTTRKIKVRVQEHLSTIRLGKLTKKVVQHCHEQRHTFSWVVLEKVFGEARNIEGLLASKEARWIFQEKTDQVRLSDFIEWNRAK